VVAHGHGHALASGPVEGREVRRRLAAVLALSVVVLVVEVVGAAVTGSLALLADAGHVLTDVAGLGLALGATVLAQRPPTSRRTWGLRRAEVLAAALQAAVLLLVGGFVLVEGARRLLSPPEVASGAMLAFGVTGLAANLLAVGVLAPHRADTFNTRAAFLEVVSDLLGSLAVVVAALVVLGTGWDRADAVASLVIAGLIVPRTVLLLRETGSVLMESTPPGLDLDRVRADILQVPHVLDVHDLHATLVATGLPVLTAHVVVDDACFEDGHVPRLLDQLQAHLAAGFDVAHSTFQFEPAGHAAHEEGRHA